MARLGVLGERLRSRLWPIPALAAAMATVLAVGLSTVRSELTSAWWPGEASSARGLLEVLAGSSLTVVALVFSLHVVALQLAASQYSPRLLRTYARDLIVQTSLAVLIATFVFSLVTLALFGSADEPPRVSVAVAVVFGLGSVAALVGVVGHIVSSLRVETMMAELHADASSVIRQVYGTDETWLTGPVIELTSGGGRPFHAPQSGFVQAVDRVRLLRWAEDHGMTVAVEVSPGTHVLGGHVLGRAYGATDADVDAALTPAVLIGHERTPDEDPGFGLMQLVDITLRALSPGVNDPTTALHALGHLTSLLMEIAELRPGNVVVTEDNNGTPRVLEARTTLGDHVEATCMPVIRAGAGDPAVLLAITRLLAAVAEVDDESAGPAVRTTAAYVERAARRSIADPRDLHMILDAVIPFTES